MGKSLYGKKRIEIRQDSEDFAMQHIKKTYMGMYSLTGLYINFQIVSKIYCY